MQAHELRVVEEKTQLDERLGKLVKFTCSEMFTSLDVAEQDLMILQQNLMMQLMGKGEAAARRELMELHGDSIEIDV